MCIPDHICGQDICSPTRTVYNVQVQFVSGISKQERANACNASDPKYFYCKRNGDRNGFEYKRNEFETRLLDLQHTGYSLQQLMFVHTNGNKSYITENILTEATDPDFFDAIGAGVLGFIGICM